MSSCPYHGDAPRQCITAIARHQEAALLGQQRLLDLDATVKALYDRLVLKVDAEAILRKTKHANQMRVSISSLLGRISEWLKLFLKPAGQLAERAACLGVEA